jgi:plastocyanin
MAHRVSLALGFGLALLMALLAAQAARAQTPDPPADGGPYVVVARQYTFSPPFPTVPVGTTVTWVNRDREAHTITGDAGLFNVEIGPREAFSYTFDQPGVYFYYCLPHDWMIGEVTVVAGSESAPAVEVARASVSQPAAEVSMVGYEFQPPTVTIEAGGSVLWTNFDPEQHTATALDFQAWTTAVLSGGQTESVTFAEPGVYGYLCIIHPSMLGEVVVLAASTEPAPAT